MKYYKEELEIIKKYQELILYVYNLFKKYPDNENLCLILDTKKSMSGVLNELLFAKHSRIKIEYLRKCYIKLEESQIYIRLAFKNKYISKKNYAVWSYKVSEIIDMLDNWIKVCQK